MKNLNKVLFATKSPKEYFYLSITRKVVTNWSPNSEIAYVTNLANCLTIVPKYH